MEATPWAIAVETLPPPRVLPPPEEAGKGCPEEASARGPDGLRDLERLSLALGGLRHSFPPSAPSGAPSPLSLGPIPRDLAEPDAPAPRPATSVGPHRRGRGALVQRALAAPSAGPHAGTGGGSGAGKQAESGDRLRQWPDWPWGFLARTRGSIDPADPDYLPDSPSHALLARLAQLSGRPSVDGDQDGLPFNSASLALGESTEWRKGSTAWGAAHQRSLPPQQRATLARDGPPRHGAGAATLSSQDIRPTLAPPSPASTDAATGAAGAGGAGCGAASAEGLPTEGRSVASLKATNSAGRAPVPSSQAGADGGERAGREDAHMQRPQGHAPGAVSVAPGGLREVVLELMRLALKLGRPAGTLPTPQELRDAQREDLELALRAHGGRQRVLELFGLSTLAPQPSLPSPPVPSRREQRPQGQKAVSPGAVPTSVSVTPAQEGHVERNVREGARGGGSRVASLLTKPGQPRVLYTRSYTLPAPPAVPGAPRPEPTPRDCGTGPQQSNPRGEPARTLPRPGTPGGVALRRQVQPRPSRQEQPRKERLQEVRGRGEHRREADKDDDRNLGLLQTSGGGKGNQPPGRAVGQLSQGGEGGAGGPGVSKQQLLHEAVGQLRLQLEKENQARGAEGAPEGAWVADGVPGSEAPGSPELALQNAGASPGASPSPALCRARPAATPSDPLSWQERVQALQARLLSTQAALLDGRAILQSSARLSGRAGKAAQTQALSDARTHQ